MNKYISTAIIVLSLFFMSCAVKKGMISIDDLSPEKILLIGVIEYDYTQLENTSAAGIELFIESEEEFSNFNISKKYLPNEQFKNYQFIGIMGDTGIYNICLEGNRTSTYETNENLNLKDKNGNLKSLDVNSLNRIMIYDGKIISFGKIIAKFKSGNEEESKNNYTCNITSTDKDTIAIYAFKKTYPLIYNKYQNDLRVIRNIISE